MFSPTDSAKQAYFIAKDVERAIHKLEGSPVQFENG
ncbi:MAG: hypothetical protein ACI9SC_000898 [Gammaproteobacteria bacterium]|jgi:hypothetical protein